MKISVRELTAMFRPSDDVNISWGGCLLPLDLENSLSMDAYGDYAVKAIHATGENSFEIDLAVEPLKVSRGCMA